MDMPKPTDAHRKLERLAGAWKGTETMQPSPWAPTGSQAEGRIQNRVALDGFALVGEYEQWKDGVAVFKGHGVTIWNPADECYEMYWYDSMGQPPEVFRGTWGGDSLPLISKNARGWARMTYTFPKPDRMVSRMEMSTDGKTWTTFFDGIYDKVTSA
jgi:hypothetical protein